MPSREEIKESYPEVYESFVLQAGVSDELVNEKLAFWASNGINCFERWVVPYFLEREREKRRPCLRLNYPPDGKCGDCTTGKCRYDRICFMCGLEGHGTFQSYPGGRKRGEYKCSKHRTFLSQLEAVRRRYGVTENDLKEMFSPDDDAVKALAQVMLTLLVLSNTTSLLR